MNAIEPDADHGARVANAVPRCLVWIRPRWRDPLFPTHCLVTFAGLALMLVFSLGLRQGVLGWVLLLAGVWPYRSVVTVHGRRLLVRWLVFHAVVLAEGLVTAELSRRSLGRARLTIRRHGAPEISLEGSTEQLVAFREALLLAVDTR